MASKIKKAKTEKFDNQTRFNWGYHDGVLAFEERFKNYGFATSMKIACPEDVLAKHTDTTYAHGWTYGYYEAQASMPGDCRTSLPAWLDVVTAGEVQP